jgi:muconolactone delta-isomerase
MLFLVELDHVNSGNMVTPESGQAFIENIILPTLARAEQLVAEKRILSGGPVVGRVALRLIVDADSAEHVDSLITSLPVWPMADTRVTPLMTFSERRHHAQDILERLAAAPA